MLVLGSRVSLRAAAKEKFPSPTNRRRRGAMASACAQRASSEALIYDVTALAGLSPPPVLPSLVNDGPTALGCLGELVQRRPGRQ